MTMDDNANTEQFSVERAREKYSALPPDASASSTIPVTQRALDYWEGEVFKEVHAVPSPFPTIDQACPGESGFEFGTYTVCAGETGKGKSIIANNCCDSALKAGIRSAYLRYEMSFTKLMSRQLAVTTGLPARELKRGTADKQTVEMARQEWGEMDVPFFTNMGPMYTVEDAVASIRFLAQEFGVKFFVVDYLQKIGIENSYSDERHKLDEISQRIQDVAEEQNVAVMAMAQLNREAYQDRKHPPTKADIHGSSRIEKDADLIILMDNSRHLEMEDVARAKMVLRVGKNRDGEGHPDVLTHWDFRNLRIEEDPDFGCWKELAMAVRAGIDPRDILRRDFEVDLGELVEETRQSEEGGESAD